MCQWICLRRGPHATVVGSNCKLWRNIVVGKVCTIENKMANTENNHFEHYAEMKKQMEKMEKNIERLSIMPA